MANLQTEFSRLISERWSFLQSEWTVIRRAKNHRTEIKDIVDINTVKNLIVERLGIIPTFFFLVILFGVQDYSSPYRNIEQGLLLLYHLLTGMSMSDMGRFIPKSSFHSLYREFYEKGRGDLARRIKDCFETMFSTARIRVLSAMERNPPDFRHVTLHLDGHDTRASYINGNHQLMYSYKLKKAGFRTQVCCDINGMILFTSPSMPCQDYNDGTMLLRMDIGSKIHQVDCIAVDGGYTLFLDQVIKESSGLSSRNFLHPIRKARGVELSEEERTSNAMFGSFRSKIEGIFGELMTTFHRFSNGSPIRVSNVEVFTIQFQLACVLLNVKTFVKTFNIPVQPHHSLWLQDSFDYPNGEISTMSVPTASIQTKSNERDELIRLQEEFLGLSLADKPDDVVDMDGEEDDEYEVEKILAYRGSARNRKYLIRWKGYGPSHDSWVSSADINADDLIRDFWRDRHSRDMDDDL